MTKCFRVLNEQLRIEIEFKVNTSFKVNKNFQYAIIQRFSLARLTNHSCKFSKVSSDQVLSCLMVKMVYLSIGLRPQMIEISWAMVIVSRNRDNCLETFMKCWNENSQEAEQRAMFVMLREKQERNHFHEIEITCQILFLFKDDKYHDSSFFRQCFNRKVHSIVNEG